jgi:hypothetical protein
MQINKLIYKYILDWIQIFIYIGMVVPSGTIQQCSYPIVGLSIFSSLHIEQLLPF